jgi:hypothetical protein
MRKQKEKYESETKRKESVEAKRSEKKNLESKSEKTDVKFPFEYAKEKRN